MEGFEKESNGTGCLETLRDRIYELKGESQDHFFTEYLVNLQERVIAEKHTVDLLYDELERKYKFYLERMEKANQPEETAVTEEHEGHPQVSEPVSIPLPEGVQSTYMHGQAAVKNKKDSEFTIGIVVFSIVGVFFLLASFAMLGEYFMNSFAKGMCLYAIALVVCIFSEAVVRRRSNKLSQVLTILGIAGVHVATYVNTFSMYNMNQIVAGVILVVMTILAIGYDKLIRKSEWVFNKVSAGAYYSFAIAAFIFYVSGGVNTWVQLAAMSILVLLTKLLAHNKALYPLDSVIAAIAAIFALAEGGTVYGYLMLGVLIISILLVRFWHMYYQCLITIITALFLAISIESEIVLTLIVAILWLFMLLFNHVRFLQGKNIGEYNYLVLVLQAICYLSLLIEDFTEYKILYFILAFLGGGFIYFMCQERYRLPEKARGLVLAIFLSYMVLVTDFTYPITASILLMLIGCISIGCGFAFADKKIRIYGLVLALFVCFKITLSDFAGGEELQRMILFFAAGVVALLISGIYIILEKKYIKD